MMGEIYPTERVSGIHIQLGEKIKTLRKARGLSQNALAQYLGVSFQTVSKWETGATMPDIALIPAIASFFHVSTDDLFGFNPLETEERVMELCRATWPTRESDPAKAEQMLREALKQHPGNDILLANLLYTIRTPERCDEVVKLCKIIIESTPNADIKYDALRILAQTYKAMGEYTLTRETLEQIPEIYFTQLQLRAMLLEGEEMYEPACLQKDLAAEWLVEMLMRLAQYDDQHGSPEKARKRLEMAQGVIRIFEDEACDEGFSKTFYEDFGKAALERIRRKLDGQRA